jgi:endoglucanase
VSALLELLRSLTELPGVSGMEQPVVSFLQERLKPFADHVEVDAFGNVVARRAGQGRGPSVMILAHSDEVGAVVTAVDPEGFLRFRTVGMVNPAVLPGARVLVAGRHRGVVGSVPGHLAKGVGGLTQASDLPIDIGAASEAQAREWGVREGSAVTFEGALVKLSNPDLVMGKAIDNRVGCALLIALFERLQGIPLPGTVYGAVSVQEEIGMRGARMLAEKLAPDWALVLDTVPAEDTPLGGSERARFRVGGGPVVQLWEGKPELFLGTVAHPSVRDLILGTADAEGIQVQLSAAYGGWLTDGSTVHLSAGGIPTGFLSVPRRYAHTPNEILDLRDAEAALALLEAIAARGNEGFEPDFLGARG